MTAQCRADPSVMRRGGSIPLSRSSDRLEEGPMLLAYDYPLLDVFVTIVTFVLFLIWLFLLVLTMSDLLRDPEPSGLLKAVWLAFMILAPYLGVIVYIFARGDSMAERELQRARRREEAFWSYVRDSSGFSGGALA
jgi:hypothetical protein